MPTARRATASHQTQRGSVPVVGTLLLVVLTVLLAVTLSTAVIGGPSTPESSPAVAVELSVDGSTLTLTQTHGEPLDIEQLSMEITVDGQPLEQQPPVPFFAASGFESKSTGAFNPSGSTELAVGESASLTVASTNSPTIEPGARVSITLYTDEGRLITVDTTAK